MPFFSSRVHCKRWDDGTTRADAGTGLHHANSRCDSAQHPQPSDPRNTQPRAPEKSSQLLRSPFSAVPAGAFRCTSPSFPGPAISCIAMRQRQLGRDLHRPQARPGTGRSTKTGAITHTSCMRRRQTDALEMSDSLARGQRLSVRAEWSRGPSPSPTPKQHSPAPLLPSHPISRSPSPSQMRHSRASVPDDHHHDITNHSSHVSEPFPVILTIAFQIHIPSDPR